MSSPWTALQSAIYYLALVLIGISTVRAQLVDNTWQGPPGVGLWSSTANWSEGVLPTATQNAIVDNGSTAQVTTVGDNAFSLTIGNTTPGSTVQMVAGDLTIVGGTVTIGPEGTLRFSGGTNAPGGGGVLFTTSILNDGIVVFNGTFQHQLGAVVTGSGSLVLAGLGPLTILSNNSYTGGTFIDTGTVILGSGGTTGSIIGDVFNNGALAFNRSDLVNFNGVISGSGGVEQKGTGTTVFLGKNTYTGGTTISAGTLQLGNGGTTGSIVGNVSIGSNGILAFNRSDLLTLGGVISGEGSVQQNGTGTTVLTGQNTYTGETNISKGTLQLGNGGTTGSIVGNVSVGSNGTLAFNRSDRLNFSGMISGEGSVLQIGTGTTVLTGENTYTGGTTINAGTLELGNGGTISGTSNVVIGPEGTLRFNGGLLSLSSPFNFLNNGSIVFGERPLNHFIPINVPGSGRIVMEGPGTLTISGTNTYTGGTIISAGTVITQNASALGTGLVAFGNGTKLEVDVLLKVNGNWMVLPGTATASGGTIETLKDFNLSGGGTLVADANFKVSGAASISSSGFVVNRLFTVNGDLDLNGNSTAVVNGELSSAKINVNDTSSLTVNDLGSIIADVNVGANSRLGLIGTIKGNIVNAGLFQGRGIVRGNVINSGLVAPGTSIGTLRIDGNYRQNPGGTLRIEAAGASPGQYDVLAVTGRADLAGKLQLVRIKNFRLSVGDQMSFLTAAGGVKGAFDTVENDLLTTAPLVVLELKYLPNSVVLEAVQGPVEQVVSFIAPTPNSMAVAEALDSAAGDPRAKKLFDYLNGRNLPELRRDIELISPEPLTSISAVGASVANVQTANLATRMENVRAGSTGFSSAGFESRGFEGVTGIEGKSGPSVFAPIQENRWGVFATGSGEFTDVESTFDASGYYLSTGGLTLGVDYRIGSNCAVGLTAGYAYTGIDLINDSHVDVNGGNFGLYATAFNGGFYLDSAVIGGVSGYNTHRTALQGNADGDTIGGELDVLVAGGYDWKTGGLTVGPTASFQYTLTGFDSFSEIGSLAPLSYAGQDVESIRTALGMRASYGWKIGSVLCVPEISAAWQHESGDTQYSLVSRFASGAGNSFTVNGPETGRDSLLCGAGVAIHWNDRVTSYAYYDGEFFRTNYQSNNVSAGVRVNF